MSDNYIQPLCALMSFLDDKEYKTIDDDVFTEARLLKITDIDIYRHLANKAFGTPEPNKDSVPKLCRSTTIKFHKKAISHFMPRYRVAWDEIRKEGNPTKSQAVNDLIKLIEKHEVRGTGIATSARRPIEWEEFIMLLVAARLVYSHREKTVCLLVAVMTLQWHLIGRIDDVMELATTTIQRNLRHPSCLQLKMRKSKNIRSERDMPTQILFASMDPLVCPYLNLAVYVEMFGTGGLGRKIFDCKSTRNFTNYLEKLFSSPFFKAVREGMVGSHSLRKGPSTYASRYGLLRDWISLRGRWRGSKKQVDTYIDVDVPFPDAKVASVLCGPRGPCKYVAKDGILLNDEFLCSIAPRCVEGFGRDVAVILARSLLWAAFEHDVRLNDEVVAIIPSDLRKKILDAWSNFGGVDNVNPMEKVGLMVSQRMDQLEIVPVNVAQQDAVTGEEVSQGGGGEEVIQNLGSQIFNLQQIVGDFRDEVNSQFCDQRRHINTLSANVRRIGLQPGVRGTVAQPASSANERNVPVRLSKCPRDLWVLWKEWEQGLGGGKPAKAFTQTERGANKFSFSRRRVFWDLVEGMLRRGQSSDVAIDNIYRVYGWNNSVTKILNEMKRDRKRGATRV